MMFVRTGEQGQGTVEYVLLLVLIAIVLIAALSMLGHSLETVFYGIAEALQFGCGQVSKQTFRSYAGEGGDAQGEPTMLYSPTDGKVTQRYWFCHNGWDVANPQGTPIRAVDDGEVKFAGWSDQGYGYLVVIDHGGRYQTLYAHLRESPLVSDGQVVTAGTVIGYMGNTGFSTGPHLHFEIRHGSNLVDPGPHLP
jgi:murein DD-endopeptidase MepM/ murein hydrolase activator NlpD